MDAVRPTQTRMCEVLEGHKDPEQHRHNCRACANAVGRSDFQSLFGLPVTAAGKDPVGGGVTRSYPAPRVVPSRGRHPLDQPARVQSRVRYCPGRQVWDWTLLIEGRVVDSDSEPTEALARAKADESKAEHLRVEAEPMLWSYGVMTVPARRGNVLPKTLESLKAAGFGGPRLFVDGGTDPGSWEREFGVETLCRSPRLGTHGNWILSTYELFLRGRLAGVVADRFLLFQDDLVTYRNLRAYLERLPYPKGGYCNFYTMHTNEAVAGSNRGVGWHESPPLTFGATYHGKVQQRGLGAVGLMFDRDAVRAVLTATHMVDRVLDATYDPAIGAKVDGGIVESMNKAGFREYVHNPSLVQHSGHVSSMGNFPHPQAVTFRGEAFDALDLLKEAWV